MTQTHILDLELVVHNKQQVAERIYEFDLRRVDGQLLPAFTAGAHIRVETPSGRVNQYSLCQSPEELHRYVITVKKEEEGQGGSKSMIEDVNVGDTLKVSQPVNVFELLEGNEYLFIAAGIGITPIYSMMQSLKELKDKKITLIYLSRSPEYAPYLDEINEQFSNCELIIHHTYGDSDNRYDMWDHFVQARDVLVYCCGPRDIMEEVRAMTGHWKTGLINFESFGVDAALLKQNKPFEVELSLSKKQFVVEENETLLEALADEGISVPSSCESGTCGSCKTAYLSGDVEHRDMVLEEHEQSKYLMVCVSRAVNDEKLVLEL